MATIMNVEDDQFTQDFIKEVLEEDKHTVLVARDSKDFFAQLGAKAGVDLVLLDIMLPGRSGWDIFGELRKRFPEIKVIFVSAIEVSEERIEELKKSGLVDYITKPFTEEVLRAAIKKALG